MAPRVVDRVGSDADADADASPRKIKISPPPSPRDYFTRSVGRCGERPRQQHRAPPHGLLLLLLPMGFSLMARAEASENTRTRLAHTDTGPLRGKVSRCPAALRDGKTPLV